MSIERPTSAFGSWLKTEREKLKISQRGLARQTGVSHGTIRGIEGGDRFLSTTKTRILVFVGGVMPESDSVIDPYEIPVGHIDVNVTGILERNAQKFGTSTDEILRRGGSLEAKQARNRSYREMRDEGMPLQAIGDATGGRDRTTVLNNVRRDISAGGEVVEISKAELDLEIKQFLEENFSGVSLEDIQSKNRIKRIVVPRQALTRYLFYDIGLNIKRISDRLLRDHSTILHAINKPEDEIRAQIEAWQHGYANLSKKAATYLEENFPGIRLQDIYLKKKMGGYSTPLIALARFLLSDQDENAIAVSAFLGVRKSSINHAMHIPEEIVQEKIATWKVAEQERAEREMALREREEVEKREMALREMAAKREMILSEEAAEREMIPGEREMGAKREMALREMAAKRKEVAKRRQLEVEDIGKLEMPAIIFAVVASAYQLREDKIISKSRKGDVAWARHLIAYFSRLYTDLSLLKIAGLLNRSDHTTIINSVMRAEEQIELDEYIKEEVESVRKSILDLAGASSEITENYLDESVVTDTSLPI